ncbi:hypothetical protein SAMN04487905_10973 [Actinopolyspora xinjiangensis]|uniref:Uncharacterized protein n=1 Tax=Actinopolyspora xinjiangensis TaxID=405564 RepID=A0A1H0VMV6_9ACTN|nr:hypothetical protein SAMN04487905_10973 [Actinopolyspora xinjiangensis]
MTVPLPGESKRLVVDERTGVSERSSRSTGATTTGRRGHRRNRAPTSRTGPPEPPRVPRPGEPGETSVERDVAFHTVTEKECSAPAAFPPVRRTMSLPRPGRRARSCRLSDGCSGVELRTWLHSSQLNRERTPGTSRCGALPRRPHESARPSLESEFVEFDHDPRPPTVTKNNKTERLVCQRYAVDLHGIGSRRSHESSHETTRAYGHTAQESELDLRFGYFCCSKIS